MCNIVLMFGKNTFNIKLLRISHIPVKINPLILNYKIKLSFDNIRLKFGCE